MWFPANHVEEMQSENEVTDTNRLGNIQKGSIELAGATVGKCRGTFEGHLRSMCANSGVAQLLMVGHVELSMLAEGQCLQFCCNCMSQLFLVIIKST